MLVKALTKTGLLLLLFLLDFSNINDGLFHKFIYSLTADKQRVNFMDLTDVNTDINFPEENDIGANNEFTELAGQLGFDESAIAEWESIVPNNSSLESELLLSQGDQIEEETNLLNLVDPILGTALTGMDQNNDDSAIANRLEDFVNSSDFAKDIELISNGNWDPDESKALLKEVAELETGPEAEIVPFNETKGSAAFGNDTIYLSQDLVEQNRDNPEAIAEVFLEEMGHYLDSQLSEQDSPGDEGAIFSSLLQNQELDDAEILSLKQEDDNGTLNVEGEAVSVELTDSEKSQGSSNKSKSSSDVVAAINAGGPALTQDGIDFAADSSFVNGKSYKDDDSSNGEQPAFDGTVYETERFGGAPSADPLKYSIPVDSGNYTVEMHFSEIYWDNPGARVFDVKVEGETVLEDVDILEETGGNLNQPFVFELPETVSPDTAGAKDAIDISLEASTDNAKVSGIVVREEGDSSNQSSEGNNDNGSSEDDNSPSDEGSTPPAKSSSGKKGLIETLNYDMRGQHEGNPAGVPQSYDWAQGPRIGMGNNPPGDWTAMQAWGQIYEDAAGNPASNTRVEIRNLEAYVLSKDGNWSKVQGTSNFDGAAFRNDFAGNGNQPAQVKQEENGNISVKTGDGYNYHFWPPTRGSIDPNDIAGIVTTAEARLVVDDPQKPDDRSEARYLMSVGADYWQSKNVGWDNFNTNGDAAMGKLKYVEEDWQKFTMNTVSPDVLANNPPPIGK
jgi:hypothetical protein